MNFPKSASSYLKGLNSLEVEAFLFPLSFGEILDFFGSGGGSLSEVVTADSAILLSVCP